jgi:hypothetical protein
MILGWRDVGTAETLGQFWDWQRCSRWPEEELLGAGVGVNAKPRSTWARRRWSVKSAGAPGRGDRGRDRSLPGAPGRGRSWSGYVLATWNKFLLEINSERITLAIYLTCRALLFDLQESEDSNTEWLSSGSRSWRVLCFAPRWKRPAADGWRRRSFVF